MVDKKINILIVEDSAVDAKYLMSIIGKNGYNCIGVAGNSIDALEYIHNSEPDIILMDIILEDEKTGFELAREIRNIKKIPVIYTSSHSEGEILEKINIEDSFGYLLKPIDKKDLFVAVEIAIKRKEFEIKLEESEIRYQNLFENSLDSIFIVDSKGQFIEFNNSLCELVEYSAEEFELLNMRDVVGDYIKLNIATEEIGKKGYVKDFEITAKTKNDKLKTCLITVNAVKNIQGKLTGYQGIIKDITEKKEAEERIAKNMEKLLREMDKNEKLTKELEQNLEDLNGAYRQLTISEERYRKLIEGTNDIIFTMNNKWEILSVNNAAKTILNFSNKNLGEIDFFNLLHDGIDGGGVEKQLILEKKEQLTLDKKPTTFKVNFKSVFATEPIELQVRLEYLNIEGEEEILGKAIRVLEDEMLKYFISERQKYEIGNFITTADDVSHRLTRNVAKYCDPREITLIRVALREIVINAIEHGNLDISFDEKTRAMMGGNYIEFLEKRQKDPECSNKKVIIEYSCNNEQVVYKITDEGDGFDYMKILAKDVEEINKELITHGRGLKMTKEIFDEIEFNKKGNQVMLVKKF